GFTNGEINLSENIAGFGVIKLGGLAKLHQGARHLPLVLAESAAQKMPKRIIGIKLQSLVQSLFGLFDSVVLIEKLSVPAPSFRVVRMLRDDAGHDPQGHVMLAVLVLTKRFVDLDVDRLATPFEFLAAAARARPIGVKSHVVPAKEG